MVIYKYTITIAEKQTINMPTSAHVLSVQVQQGMICIWAVVSPSSLEGETEIYMYGTGHTMESNRKSFIGTVQLDKGELVFHVFRGWK